MEAANRVKCYITRDPKTNHYQLRNKKTDQIIVNGDSVFNNFVPEVSGFLTHVIYPLEPELDPRMSHDEGGYTSNQYNTLYSIFQLHLARFPEKPQAIMGKSVLDKTTEIGEFFEKLGVEEVKAAYTSDNNYDFSIDENTFDKSIIEDGQISLEEIGENVFVEHIPLDYMTRPFDNSLAVSVLPSGTIHLFDTEYMKEEEAKTLVDLARNNDLYFDIDSQNTIMKVTDDKDIHEYFQPTGENLKTNVISFFKILGIKKIEYDIFDFDLENIEFSGIPVAKADTNVEMNFDVYSWKGKVRDTKIEYCFDDLEKGQGWIEIEGSMGKVMAVGIFEAARKLNLVVSGDSEDFLWETLEYNPLSNEVFQYFNSYDRYFRKKFDKQKKQESTSQHSES